MRSNATIVARWLWVGLLAWGAAACYPPPSAAQRPKVPPVAPTSAPRELWSPANYARDSTYTRGTFLRDIAVILFKRDASQAERQAAVDAVAGTVVGGRSLGNGDGYYLVRVPGDGTARPLFEALHKLRSMPQVEDAAPQYVGVLSP